MAEEAEGQMSYNHQKDHKAYLQIEDSLKREHLGKTALLHDGSLVSVEDDGGAAYRKGCEKFGPGNFSTEDIGKEPIRLGAVGISL